MVVQETFGKNGKCSICKLSEIDVVNYGEIHANKELTVHLFCLYFSSSLPQNGKDNSGIVGFELRDIRTLISNSDETKCCYCGKGSATTNCHYKDCRRTFHQVCGFKVNARFEYLGAFRSFCDEHNRIENENLDYPEINGCFICYDELPEFNPVTTIPSCSHCEKWFHQKCLRNYALNAGYAFKCPTCRNRNYAEFARRHGIYVPEYEALWEKTHDYADIEGFYTHCDADDCLCPKDRTFSNHKWNFQLCSCCGSFGYHKLCRPEAERNDIIICDNCKTTVGQWASSDPHNTQTMLEDLHLKQEEDAKEQEEEDAKRQAEEAKREENEIVIDLTCDNILNERVASDVWIEAEEIAGENGEIVTVDLTNYEEQNVMPNSRSRKRIVKETLAEKRAREKAFRPERDRMRNDRINFWFRDYERITQELVEYI